MKSSGKTQHFMALDGLRGVAAVVVAFYHRRFWLGGYDNWHGYLAVDFFFLLSGFVISHAYGARIASRKLSLIDFATVRIIRLYPLILLGACLGTAGYVIEGMQKHWLGLGAQAVAAFPFAALALPQPFLKEPFLPNGPVWSLFFEIIANIAFILAVPRLRLRTLLILAAGLGVALAFAICTYGQLCFGWLWPTMPLGLPRVGFPFLLGVIFQRLHATRNLRVPALPIWITAPMLAAILFVPVLGWLDEMLFSLATVFVVLPLIVASAANDQPSRWWLRISTASAALSYPLYILHMPLLHLLDLVPGFAALPVAVRYSVAMSSCIVAAFASGRFFDEPVRRHLRGLALDASTSRRPARLNARSDLVYAARSHGDPIEMTVASRHGS